MDYGDFIGFETIGNATLIAIDKKPILATDPWLARDAFFGSFVRTNEIPEVQRQLILDAPFIWLSHGHPDHIDAATMERLQGKNILLPDHVGNRIRDDLAAEGFKVRVLKNCEWVQLSENIKIYCISDYFQDAVLLVNINGRLIVNTNDASDLGRGSFVKKEARKFDKVYLLKLFGTGVGDMANMFDEQGNRVLPPSIQKKPAGKQIEFYTRLFGATDVIPFSSFHAYQRTDSFWANEFRTKIEELDDGFSNANCTLHLPFARADCESDCVENINPPLLDLQAVDPTEFGDDWADRLDETDKKLIEKYFKDIGTISDQINFINLVVGGETMTIELSKKKFIRGITFETPRASLMTTVSEEIFDDLLIGNFTKTTLHGDWSEQSLHPYFTPYVAKYADNGRAKTKAELDAYFEAYRARAPLAYILNRFERGSERRLRKFVGTNTAALQLSKKIYLFLKRA